ncbi:uncharacterized protein B0H18DRAFT_1040256 [Fomitopsis serialis]|uniref:uncharacterized protein n=1 Tax=Fomitopsis serialis TaxID=139415 RepID=UPI00200740BB|nr:uncharacterized protein B0H18DRAFT_1040256 [Neoantrodia serialis]KAH9915743.1 hypothetical protein B0H18DRAFT_1040256 [Neoantrodia serialis]
MVMANKWVLNTTDVPLFFLDMQLIIAVVLFLFAHMFGMIQLPLRWDWQIIKGLIPTVSLSLIGLSLSNYTLKYVDASFYQVARGMVLPFTVGTSFFLLHARPSLRILMACSIVTSASSSMITALHSVVIKKSLDVVHGSALHLSWYTNLLSVIALTPVVVLGGELPGVMKLLFGPESTPGQLYTFMLGSLITVSHVLLSYVERPLRLLMSIASLLSIKVTSPITHMVSSAVRGVAASLLGMWLFHDIITTGRASSIAIILLGSLYYTWVKHSESQLAQQKPSNGVYDRVPLEDIEAGKQGKPE